MSTKKATEMIRYYKNPNGPTIGVTAKDVIESDGLYFKDLNCDGTLNTYKDWRKTPSERAKALAEELSSEEKIGLLFINSLKMGAYQEDKEAVDATGLLDEKVIEKDTTIFNAEKYHGTTYTVKDMGIRHFILRENPKPDELADWMNELNALAEGETHAIPVLMVSNSRNENGEIVFGMNDAAGVFATWPGTMGIAAAVKGSSLDLIDDFAECIREEWDATGMKKGYMYMADVVSDPRWQRTYGTFGEDPELINNIFDRLVPGIQGSKDGVTTDGVAMTVKHFPGGGARENGFDPHYKQGQWNVYQTEDSLQKYHLPGFRSSIANHVSSIMPYYAKPAAEKSGIQYDMNGNPIEMIPVGFAFNQFFLKELLQNQMNFQGYINSDSGITINMAWGVEELDIPERIALAVNSGVDIISGSFDVFAAKEALDRRTNGYYTDGAHKIPDGYTLEQITLSEEALTTAAAHTLKEMFELGVFENPYRDPQTAKEVIANPVHWKHADDVHRKSVVLLKNKEQLLPLTAEKLADKKIFAKGFASKEETAKALTEKLHSILAETPRVTLTDHYEDADYAFLFASPSSGEYFNATKGYLELDICENKTVHDVDDLGRPAEATHEETTLLGTDEIRVISEAIHANGGKVISNINFTLAWMVGNVERYSDALLAGFDTFPEATIDIITGAYTPSGKMPITLPKDDSVLAVNADGVCVSRNDVPGYDKDFYMPEEMKDENGKAYAYRDSEGNYYEMNFGLEF